MSKDVPLVEVPSPRTPTAVKMGRRHNLLIGVLVASLVLVASVANFAGPAKIATALPGNVSSVLDSPGKNGTTIAADPAVAALLAALTAQQSMNSGYNKPHGTKWIDINLTNFKVTLYEGTTKVNQFVSVTGAKATPTISGTFNIYRKYAVKDMQGTNADGSKWFVANVRWCCFFIRGFAIHAAPWRATFGYQASHGCVNLPTSAAKIVYDWAPVGTRVVVHK